MTSHVHYDLDAHAARSRAAAKDTLERLIKAAGEGSNDAAFYRAQFAFAEASLQFNLATLKLRNEGANLTIHFFVGAAGVALGEMAGSFLGKDAPPEVVADLMWWFSKSLNDVRAVARGGKASDGAVVQSFVPPVMPSSRA